jgi:hypothetical protein
MGKKNKPKKENKKKELRNTIVAKLEAVLSDFKNELNEKKFKEALKRGGKLLSNLLSSKKKKEKKKKKKPPKETTENTSQ